MKKILFLLAVFASFKSFGQYPVKQHIGGDSTEVWATTFWGKKGVINGRYPDTATANLSRISQYPDAQIVAADTLWIRNSTATAWIKIVTGANPTLIYVKDDLTVDTITNPGFQTLGRLHNDGLVSGGIVTSAGCMDIAVTSASYYLNGIHYVSAQTTLTVGAADPSNPRIDYVVSDTFGTVSIVPGTPSPIPNTPFINPSSQVILSQIYVPAAATCLSINSIVIYDETGGTEYTPSTSGTITADPTNTANPEHLTVAYYITSYADGAQIIFTKPSGEDTVFNNSVFRFGAYFNGGLGGQMQMQLFLGGNPVSSNIVLNPYFNPLDSTQYQIVGVPRYAFGGSGNIITDSIVFTLAGDDLSGAKGFYFDYFQLQTGVQNNVLPPIVYSYGKNATRDSTILLMSNGVRYAALDSVGTGGGGSGIGEVVAGYGLLNANDSTLLVDTSLIQKKITLTTTGSGAATFVNDVLNIPTPALSSGGIGAVYAQAPLIAVNDSTLGITQSGTATDGYLSSTDWNIFNTKQTALSGTGYLKFAGTTPSYLTPTQVTADLNLFTSTLKGLTPLSGGGTTNYLRADGTWAAPPGTGSGWATTGGNAGTNYPDTSVYLGTNNNTVLRFKTNSLTRAIIDSAGLFISKSLPAVGGLLDSVSITLNPVIAGDGYIRFFKKGASDTYLTSNNTGGNWLSIGTTANAVDKAIRCGIITSVGANSSFKNSSGANSFIIGASTDVFIGLQHTGSVDVGGWGSASGSTDITGRMNGATNPTNGTQFMRMFGATQNVNIGTATTDVPSSLFTVNAQTNTLNTYKASIPAPKMTTGQRDSIISGIVQAGYTTAAGTGYTPGTYVNKDLINGTGAGGHATIVVGAGGTVTGTTITDAGGYYTVGDVLTASLPAGSGYSITLTSVTSTVSGAKVYNTSSNSDNAYNGVNWTGDFVVSGAGTLTLKHGVDYVFTGTTSTWTLPAVSATLLGRQNIIRIKNRGSGTITLNSNAGSTLYNTAAQSTINVIAGAACELMPDGTYFLVMFNQ